MDVVAAREKLVVIYQIKKGDTFEAGHTRDHSLWKVNIEKAGVAYSLDLTCAQFGHFEPAIPWSEYTALRCSEHEALPDGTIVAEKREGLAEIIESCQKLVVKELLSMLEMWDEKQEVLDGSFTLGELLRQPQDVYDEPLGFSV